MNKKTGRERKNKSPDADKEEIPESEEATSNEMDPRGETKTPPKGSWETSEPFEGKESQELDWPMLPAPAVQAKPLDSWFAMFSTGISQQEVVIRRDDR